MLLVEHDPVKFRASPHRIDGCDAIDDAIDETHEEAFESLSESDPAVGLARPAPRRRERDAANSLAKLARLVLAALLISPRKRVLPPSDRFVMFVFFSSSSAPAETTGFARGRLRKWRDLATHHWMKSM